MAARTLRWVGGIDGYLELLDQRQLPGRVQMIRCDKAEQVYEAIQTLAVRGAPAIGVAAAYGLVLALREMPENEDGQNQLELVRKAAERLGHCRPTAVNLFRATQRVKIKAEVLVVNAVKGKQFRQAVLAEADAIRREDEQMCRQIGENGQGFIREGMGVLTHCNAGSLATAGQGTALSVLYEAHKQGRRFRVFADETRPLLQGARLTAWELQQAGIDVTVVCDDMAGWLMKQGRVDIVITGADRIAANGDVANKIGTYSLSTLAAAHGVPFCVAAPSSTFDLQTHSGGQIPIEQRSAEEVRFCGGRRVVPEAASVWNPAFDVTPAGLIEAIITELGVITGPTAERIAGHLRQDGI